MKDSLGDRIKDYEDRTRYYLPRRTYSVVRVDGKAFHTYTKQIKAKKPFDEQLMDAMNFTAKSMCENMVGAKLAYVQSDEISIVLADMEKLATEAWFDGNLQKISSVSSSLATGFFNSKMKERGGELPIAFFDARVFCIPDKVEVSNAMLWRYKDWVRNSVQMLARSEYSHKQLHSKKVSDMHDMIHDKGLNWAELDSCFKNGRLIVRDESGWKVIPAQSSGKEFREFIMSQLPEPGYE